MSSQIFFVSLLLIVYTHVRDTASSTSLNIQASSSGQTALKGDLPFLACIACLVPIDCFMTASSLPSIEVPLKFITAITSPLGSLTGLIMLSSSALVKEPLGTSAGHIAFIMSKTEFNSTELGSSCLCSRFVLAMSPLWMLGVSSWIAGEVRSLPKCSMDLRTADAGRYCLISLKHDAVASEYNVPASAFDIVSP
jgi:hypothetical protein